MIDHHYHLTNRNFEKDLITLQENMDMYNIDKVITLASYFPRKGSGLSNYRLFHGIQNIDNVYMLTSLDFEYYFYQHLNEVEALLKENKVLGIKIYTGYQNIKIDKLEKVLDLAKGKIVMFHTGFCHKQEQETFNPALLVNVIEKYPEITFILSHLGNPHLIEMSDLINRYKNVYTDMSGLMDKEEDWERAKEAIDFIVKFGDKKKILFGSDFPVQTHENSFRLVKEYMFILENSVG